MMTRRRFLHDAAMGSAAVVFPCSRRGATRWACSCSRSAPQWRRTRRHAERIAGLGYEEVETYGIDPAGLGYYGMPAKDFAQRLRDHKLTTPSGHYDLNLRDDQRRRSEAVRRPLHRGRALLGQAYITWPLLDAARGRSSKFKTVARTAERRSARGSRRPGCSSRITTTMASSSSRTARSATTSS